MVEVAVNNTLTGVSVLAKDRIFERLPQQLRMGSPALAREPLFWLNSQRRAESFDTLIALNLGF